MFYYEQPWWFGLTFFVVGSMVLWGVYGALFAVVMSWVARRTHGTGFALAAATTWVACELLRSRLVTGEPWMLLGYALVPHVSLIQAADLGGVYLLSFIVMLVNASIASVFVRPAAAGGLRFTPLAVSVVAVLALVAYGRHRLATPLPTAPSVPVALVQGNLSLGSQWREAFYGQGLDHYLAMSRDLVSRTRPRVLVWPESSITFFLTDEPWYQASIAKLLRKTDVDLLLGAPHHGGDEEHPLYFNSAYYVTADGRIADRYDKAHLLPFAEYFPLRFIGFLRRNFERVRTFTPGSGETLLDTRMGKVAVVICFEALFPERVRRQMARGADVLVNLSNDAWLGAWAGPEQHASMVVLRAVENRTWVIRATTTGVSTIIDPYGRIQARTDTLTAATLDTHVVPMRIGTVYKQWGDAFAHTCLFGSLAMLIVLRRRQRSITTT